MNIESNGPIYKCKQDMVEEFQSHSLSNHFQAIVHSKQMPTREEKVQQQKQPLYSIQQKLDNFEHREFFLSQQQSANQSNLKELPGQLLNLQDNASLHQQSHAHSDSNNQYLIEKSIIQSLPSVLFRTNVEGRFPNMNAERFQQLFIEEFLEMDRRGQLLESEKPFVNALIHCHSNMVHEKPLSPGVNRITKNQDYPKDYLTNIYPAKDQTQPESDQMHKTHSRPSTKKKNESSFVSTSAHLKFYNFLHESMRKLKVYRQIREVCIKNITCLLSITINSFLHKLIVIKSFFPHYFIKIMRQFILKIEEFKQKEATNEIEMYAKDILAPRYLGCIISYVQSDDITAAALQLYKGSLSSYQRKSIFKFQEYQKEMKHQAQISKSQKQISDLPINSNTNSIKSQKMILQSSQSMEVRSPKRAIQKYAEIQKLDQIKQQNSNQINEIERQSSIVCNNNSSSQIEQE